MNKNNRPLFSLIATAALPKYIDNSSLMPRKIIQNDLANCVVISVCNILEAKYWQLTGNIIKFDYDYIYTSITAGQRNPGISYSSIKKILKLINTAKIFTAKQLQVFSKPECGNTTIFIELLRSSIHAHQFASIGCSPGLSGSGIWFKRNEPHTLTVCGYSDTGFIIRTTDANQPSEINVSYSELYDSFEVFSCFRIS